MKTDIDLNKITLTFGAHRSREDGMCAMELAAYIAGQPHSDHPPCVSPVIGAFLLSWNDALDDETRQKLKPYVVRAVGTAATEDVELQRSYMACDWMVREFAPARLYKAGLRKHARSLRALTPVTSESLAQEALPILSAAWSAAKSAAKSAAWSAAESAAWSAAWSAAESAAWSAAWSAAESAAKLAAESALTFTAKRLQRSAFDLLDRMIEVSA